MDSRVRLTALFVTWLLATASEPAALAANTCLGEGEMSCSAEPSKPVDLTEREHSQPVAQRQEAVQLPPAPDFPAGRDSNFAHLFDDFVDDDWWDTAVMLNNMLVRRNGAQPQPSPPLSPTDLRFV
jgi:hypothetical protein